MPFAARGAGETTTFAGIGVGASVLAAIAAHGMPQIIATKDTGQHFTWTLDGMIVDAIANDEAIVRAVDIMPTGPGATVGVDIAGKRRILAFGVLSASQADSQFAEAADFADLQNHTRTYEITDFTELALVFDPKTDLLTRAVYGDRGTVSLLGYLRSEFVLPLHAPTDGGKPIVSLAPKGLLRVDIDQKGVVRKETVLLSGGDPAKDAAVEKAIDNRNFGPAKLADHYVKSTFYRGITP